MSESYKSPPVGHEISAVMRGVNPIYFANRPGWAERIIFGKESPLISAMKDALRADNFSILGISSENFSGGGLAATMILSESHLATHTYQEYDAIYFNMYSCRGPEDAKNVMRHLSNIICPADYYETANNRIPLEGAKMLLGTSESILAERRKTA
jgi:S-adenosylmethionine/arginine decarboxylase-like enzyme